MTNDFPYRKIPGSRQGPFLGASLWLADDHILAVKNTRFNEEYRRYYLNDIQALVMIATPKFAFSVYVVLGLAASVIAAFILYFTRYNDIYNYLLAVIFLFLVYMGWILYFRSCECHIVTAVSRDELLALHRIPAAKQAFAMIAERVREVQGALPEEWTGELTAPALSEEPLVVTPANRPAYPFAWLTALLLFAHAGILLSLPGNVGKVGMVVNGIAYLGKIVAAIAAVVQIRGRKLPALRAALITIIVVAGIVLYLNEMVPAFMAGMAASNTKLHYAPEALKILHNVSAGADIVLGIVLTAVLFSTHRGRDST